MVKSKVFGNDPIVFVRDSSLYVHLEFHFFVFREEASKLYEGELNECKQKATQLEQQIAQAEQEAAKVMYVINVTEVPGSHFGNSSSLLRN